MRTFDGEYHFQLADFGLSNEGIKAHSFKETLEYIAPEMRTGQRQSTKVDIWSLWMTLAWIGDIGGFRSQHGKFHTVDAAIRAALEGARVVQITLGSMSL